MGYNVPAMKRSAGQTDLSFEDGRSFCGLCQASAKSGDQRLLRVLASKTEIVIISSILLIAFWMSIVNESLLEKGLS